MSRGGRSKRNVSRDGLIVWVLVLGFFLLNVPACSWLGIDCFRSLIDLSPRLSSLALHVVLARPVTFLALLSPHSYHSFATLRHMSAYRIGRVNGH